MMTVHIEYNVMRISLVYRINTRTSPLNGLIGAIT
jgi:hypothetical protein